MNTVRNGLQISLLIVTCASSWAFADQNRIGFLVVAPDRGFIGNQETQAVFQEFKKSYTPASLALIGRDYNGVGTEYSAYLSRALEELRQAGVTEIVSIPLFLSQADPVLQKVTTHLPAYAAAATTRWAAPMAESYLVGQIVLDHVEVMSRDPEQERLFVIGVGATDEASERALKADLDRLISYVSHRKSFKETQAVVYYDRDAAGAEAKNKAVDASIIQAAAKKGRTIAIPATLGPKFDYSMALTHWIGQKFKELDVLYAGEELMPHPNVLLWLKKSANQYVAATRNEVGVIVMPHGATQPWNDAVERVIAPVKSRYLIEVAYGMGDPRVIQQAVSRLEERGVRRIVFVRMFALSHHMKERIEYILGLTEIPPAHDHDHPVPAQVRSAALFATFGGYEEYPGIAQILHERIVEISQDPSRESVLLLAHGDKGEEGNTKWLQVMQANIERLQQEPHCAKLKAIRAATVREDWPELRDKAVGEIRALIQDNAKHGRVLVIADRLYGAGPYRKLLSDLEYVLNDKGLAHPSLTQWLEEGIRMTATALASPAGHASQVSQR